MNKVELIKAIAEETQTSQVAAKAVVESIVNAIVEGLKKGEKIQFAGFGTWSIKDVKARTARNPKTGAKIKVAAKKKVKFKAGKSLTEEIN